MEHGDAALTDVRQQAAAGCHRLDLCSASTMSTETTPATTAGTPTDAPTTNKSLPGVFGVDQRGAVHRYDAVAERLVVTDGDHEVVHEREMSGTELRTAWIPHVGRERGWIDHWLDADGAIDATGRLGRALKAVDTEDDA